MDIDALIFDKDGTLFDFQATWGHWCGEVLTEFCDGDTALLNRVAEALDYDLTARKILPASIVIAATPREIALHVLDFFPNKSLDDLLADMNAKAKTAPQVAVTPLVPFFEGLKTRGLKLAVMTNDAESSAKAHLADAAQVLDMVVGSDSGFGAKPDPDPLLAIANALGVDPARCAMVGDSTHDLGAGRAAGMKTIGVLTGPAVAKDLADLADIVLDDISDIPSLLGL